MKNLFYVFTALLIILVSDIHFAQWSTDPMVNNQICRASGNQFSTQIVSDQSGGAIIVWDDLRNGNNYDVYAQRISSTGVVLWSFNGVAIAAASNDQTLSAIISDDGGAIISWTDFRGGNYSDIYAQKINANGVPQWTVNGVQVCTATNSQFNPSLISDGNGGAIIIWQDDRNGTFSGNIFAQLINSFGLPVWGSNGILISWQASLQENISGYKIYRYERGLEPKLIGSVTADVSEYLDKSVTDGNLYFYFVSTVNANGIESVSSDEVGIRR